MLNSEELINKVKGYNKFLNPEKLNKAYDFAVKAHSNQKRASGDPYSVHPIEVANILTDLKLDSATITTGLLHDTIEDTYATYETIKGEFGSEVADLVDGVTKISVLENTASANSKAENFRKLILATSKDIRVLLVKIADRLHNMRTIKAIDKEDKRKRIAQETMEIYAPLADRMGMHRIRDELEDLSFEILNHEGRSLIQKRLEEIKLDKKDIFESLSSEFNQLLNENNRSAAGRDRFDICESSTWDLCRSRGFCVRICRTGGLLCRVPCIWSSREKIRRNSACKTARFRRRCQVPVRRSRR